MYALSIDDVAKAGEFKSIKAASLVRMKSAGLPVPPTYFVLNNSFNAYFSDHKGEIFDIIGYVDTKSMTQLEDAHGAIQKFFEGTKMRKELKKEIVQLYEQLGQPFVAVRSSNWAEWIEPTVGQKTYLNVKGYKEVLRSVKKCWSNFFDAETIRNLQKHKTNYQVTVIVQEMVAAENAGVALTLDPRTGNKKNLFVEAAYGLPAGITSGVASPDSYVIDKRTQALVEKHIATKRFMLMRDPKSGATKKEQVPKEKQGQQVMDEAQLKQLLEVCTKVEKLYKSPQEVEWGIMRGNTYLLESRPLTVKFAKHSRIKGAKPAAVGVGASAGFISGRLRHITAPKDVELVQEGDIVYTALITPDIISNIKKAAGFIFRGGGVTSHASTLAREMMKPCVILSDELNISSNEMVTIDGASGRIYTGMIHRQEQAKKKKEYKTKTKIKVNISLPDGAEQAAALGADGVGLLRAKLMVLELGMHPKKWVITGRGAQFSEKMAERIATVAKAFYPRPVWYRCLDMPTNELRALDGGLDEPYEENPMLGWRGIKRSLDEPEILKAELTAVKLVHEMGYDNVGVMFPLIRYAEEVRRAKAIAKGIFTKRNKIQFGVMVETPAAALTIDLILDEGIHFVSFGTNDLTQYTIAVDRNDHKMKDYYKESHPAVMRLIAHVIKECKARKVTTSICGRAGSSPEFAKELVRMGIDEISVDVDSYEQVRETISKIEKRLGRR